MKINLRQALPFPKTRLGRVGLALAAAAFAALLALVLAWCWMSRDVDRFLAHFALRVPRTVTKVLDRNGDVMAVFGQENRVVIPYGDIPRAFVAAVIATEDSEFLTHGGILARAIVRGFGTFAIGGRQAPQPFLIRKILDRQGQVLEAHDGTPGEQVLDPMSNYQLLQCLQGVAQRGTGARARQLGWPLAGKTGTTNYHTDAWFLGFSTRIVCGVWVGLDPRQTIYRGADGTKVALPIWMDFMKVALAGSPREAFPVPDGMEWADVDRHTGLLATGDTPGQDRLRLAFKPGTAPQGLSTPEARSAVRGARGRAHSQPPEDRVWSGGAHALPPPPIGSVEPPGQDPLGLDDGAGELQAVEVASRPGREWNPRIEPCGSGETSSGRPHEAAVAEAARLAVEALP